MKRILSISGKTTDGTKVLKGIFKMIDTHGLTLDLIIQGSQTEGYLIDWIDFYECTIRAGWKPDGTLQKIRSAYQENGLHDECDHVMGNLRHYILNWAE